MDIQIYEPGISPRLLKRETIHDHARKLGSHGIPPGDIDEHVMLVIDTKDSGCLMHLLILKHDKQPSPMA